ncbi:MAG: ArsR/SmtB family transcription factor [Nitrososphaerales archaeon]
MTDIIKVACSPTRLKILNILASRPHTMQELSSLLTVTPQAVMKHLKILERYGLIKTVELEEFGKQMICLAKYVYANLYSDRSLDSFCIYAAKSLSDEIGYEFEAKKFAEALQEIDDEIYLTKRRLRALETKEHRLHKKLVELNAMKQALLSKHCLTDTDILIMQILESKDPQKTVEEVAKVLGSSKEHIIELIEKFKERFFVAGSNRKMFT